MPCDSFSSYESPQDQAELGLVLQPINNPSRSRVWAHVLARQFAWLWRKEWPSGIVLMGHLQFRRIDVYHETCKLDLSDKHMTIGRINEVCASLPRVKRAKRWNVKRWKEGKGEKVTLVKRVKEWKVKKWKGEQVKRWKGEKVKRWKGDKAKRVKRWTGEKVKRWKGEKVESWKGEKVKRVKRWKGEKGGTREKAKRWKRWTGE